MISNLRILIFFLIYISLLRFCEVSVVLAVNLWAACRQIHLRKMFRKTKQLVLLSREVKRRLTQHWRLIGLLLAQIKLKTAEMKSHIPRIAVLDKRQHWAATHSQLMIWNNKYIVQSEGRKQRVGGVGIAEQRAGGISSHHMESVTAAYSECCT